MVQTQSGLNQLINVMDRELKAVKNDIAQILQHKKEGEKVWAFSIHPAVSQQEAKEIQEWAANRWT